MSQPWIPDNSARDVPKTPLALREDIPGLADQTYFNWGASGPSPRTVVDSVEAALEWQEYESPGAEGMYPAAGRIFGAARTAVASLFGVAESEIALTQSTTEGINRVATAIDWDPGDVVVTTDLEHAAGRLPWTRLESAEGITVRVIETNEGVFDLSTVDDALTDADLFCFSAIDWIYGRVHPVSELVELAHENGAIALVDAVQTPGQQPVDFHSWDADVVAGAGHKWLLGPWGAGFLYVADNLLDSFEPIHVGYHSIASSSGGEYELAADASRFELGTMSPAPFAGLTTAIDVQRSIGIDLIRDRIQSLRQRFVEDIPAARLQSPPTAETGLVTIQTEDPEKVITELEAADITIRSLPKPESIRVSIHAMNTVDEIDALQSALEAVWE